MPRNPSHRIYERRYRATARQLSAAALRARLGCGHHPTCLAWWDNGREEHGDYLTLARLFYSTGRLEWHGNAERGPFAALIRAEAARYPVGARCTTSAAGQSVTIGYAMPPTSP